MKDQIKKRVRHFLLLVQHYYNEIVSFSLDNIFELLHIKFPKQRWIHVLFYFFKDHCPQRAASLSFYIITYMVSGLFLLIFISEMFELNFAETMISQIINYFVPAEISQTTDYILNFTKEILEKQSFIYIAAGIALFNMFFLLIEIKEHFDEILDHYYTKSTGLFIWHQLLKILSMVPIMVLFHLFIGPALTLVSQVTFGAMAGKYGIMLLFLWILFHHSSNSQKLGLKVTFKGALISTSLLWILDYLIFDLLATKHSFFGSENHKSSLGVVFLFPFWIYLAWNIVFIGLEYISTNTRSASKKFPFIFKQYVKFSVLELLYKEKELSIEYVTNRFGIDYRFFQMEIKHRFEIDHFLTYDPKTDKVHSCEGWEKNKIFDYFDKHQFLVSIENAAYFSLFNQLSLDEQNQLTFENFFTLKDREEPLPEESIWSKFKHVLFGKIPNS